MKQLTMLSEHRIEPPDCYDQVAEAIEKALENDCDFIEEFTPSELTTDMIDCAGFGEEFSREDIERSIRIYRERKEHGH